MEIPGLKQEHKILIKEPGTFLGSFEKDISDRAMEMYLNKMDLEIEKLRAELASKVKSAGVSELWRVYFYSAVDLTG